MNGAASGALRSGITIAVPEAPDASVVRDLCRALAEGCDEFVTPENPEAAYACTFAFEATPEPLGIAVRTASSGAVDIPPHVGALLGVPIAGVVRLDAIVSRYAPETTLRVERLLVVATARLADRLGGLAYDDVGAIYDPAELRRLVATDGTRADAASFVTAVVAATAPAPPVAAFGRDAAPPTGLPIEDARPDVASAAGVAFVAVAGRLPFLTATRALLAANGAAGANPGRLPVFFFAPDLAEADRAAAAAAGLVTIDDLPGLRAALTPAADAPPAEPPAVRRSRERDELAVFATGLNRTALAMLLERRVYDVALAAATSESADGPMRATTLPSAAADDLPVALARFVFDGADAVAYHLALGRAHPFLAALAAGHPDLAVRLGQAASDLALFEIRTDPDLPLARRELALARADAFVVSLAADLSNAYRAIATDATGAVYDGSELVRLATARLGRTAAWSRRVSTA